eukprot:Blabericola_migrator_1__8040@NODE_4127_length_1319_cov_12_387380_g2554_i0_p1_GENE_NODE_4127_length_1319_cov_12_387380_g2554_i0NODE_4127_length_1319_cov_12_387380_g2554_i0_p1_ORF_typecomplete_len106_score13_60_NODE_4127_length_1319_cov_12_387380_g2554_i07181035
MASARSLPTANPEPNEARFHPQWPLSLIGQMKSGDIDPLLSVESYLIDVLTWREEFVNIDDGYSALGKGRVLTKSSHGTSLQAVAKIRRLTAIYWVKRKLNGYVN